MRGKARLSVKTVESMRRAGYFGDGEGLYLAVSPTRSKSWIFRYTRNGKQTELGLGSQRDVTLAEARQKAADFRKQLTNGIDPKAARAQAKSAEALARASAISFDECASKYIEAHKAGWRNAKHGDQWRNTIKTYASPVFGKQPVQAVDTALVLRALEPIWTTKPETATRLRGRIEKVIDWATVRNYRSGDNPALWKGRLDKLLPSVNKQQNVKHHAALPYDQMGGFMAKLRAEEGIGARALEFTILTACRTGEAIGARPEEFDLDKALWTIPAMRMKSGREHRVPLSPRAVAIVQKQIQAGASHVFPAAREGKALSNMAMAMVLRRLGRRDITVHGFRSTFKDWCSEATGYADLVSEMALAHVVGDRVERAYRRTDLFDKRRRLMAEWAKYCDKVPAPAKVLQLTRQAGKK